MAARREALGMQECQAAVGVAAQLKVRGRIRLARSAERDKQRKTAPVGQRLCGTRVLPGKSGGDPVFQKVGKGLSGGKPHVQEAWSLRRAVQATVPETTRQAARLSLTRAA